MIQFDTTFLGRNIEDVPANRLKLLNQFINFIPKIDTDSGIEYTNHEVLVLSKIFLNHIYLFEGNLNKIELCYKREYETDTETLEEMCNNNDQEGLIQNMLEEIDFDSERISRVYFKLKNKLHLMEDDPRGYRINEITDDSNHYWNDTCNKLYNSIFNQDDKDKLHNYWYNQISEKNYCLQYMYIKLDQDNVLVFALTHDLHHDKLQWNAHKTIFFINRNKKYITVDWDFDNFFELIKENYQIWDFCLKAFNQYLDNFNIDVESYLEDKSKLSNLISNFNYGSDIYNFFTPLYSNQKLKLNIYLNFTRKGNYYIYIYVLDGKILHSNDIKQLENGEELFSKTRIVDAIKNFKEYNNSGISPYDGKLYKYGELIKQDESDFILNNYNGFITKNREYYYREDGFYVKANKEQIQELNDALELMNSLSNWAKKESVV